MPAKIILILLAGSFLALAGPIKAQTYPPAGGACPAGYFKHGGFCCSSDTKLEKPASAAFLQKFCQPQAAGCQAAGGKFCAAGTRNVCCAVNNVCGKGTALGFEVAVCVPPASNCGPKSPGYAGQTKDGKNVCCRVGDEPGPPRTAVNAPYCQPKSASSCAPGEQFIQGTGDNRGDKRCCAADTAPSRHPNGLPFCAIKNSRVEVVSPKDGESINGLFPIRVALSPQPGDPIAEVQLFIDDKFERKILRPLLSWEIKLRTWKLAPGPHTLKFVVASQLGQIASAERRVDIVPDTAPPAVEFVNPLPGATELPVVAGSVYVRINAKDQSGIGSLAICVNGQCSNPPCRAKFGTDSAFCDTVIPVSQLLNKATQIVGVAYDQAWDPNRAAAGIEFPPPLKIETNSNNSSLLRFNI